MYTLVRAEIWTIARTDQGNAVLIRPIGSEIAVPIFIGQLETQSILIGFVYQLHNFFNSLLIDVIHVFSCNVFCTINLKIIRIGNGQANEIKSPVAHPFQMLHRGVLNAMHGIG